MARSAISLFVGVAALAALSMSPAYAQSHQVQGIIVTNQNGQLTVKTPSGNKTYVLHQGARIRSISGPLGGQKETVPPASLIPGLPVTMDVEGNVATEVDYKAKDYKTAAQIQAGVEETSRRSEELRTAYSKMGDWDIRAEHTVYYKTGSAVMSSADKQELIKLAEKAAGMKGYVISVLGYADPRGNTKANQRLSNQRAQAVINYIKQSGKVLPGRVLGASAMGEMHIPIDKPSASELQGARKVIVRVLTSAAHLNQ